MPAGRDPDDSQGAASPKLRFSQRLILALPHLKHDKEKVPLTDRLRKAVLKPEEPGAASDRAKSPVKASSVEDLEEAAKFANDKERLIGLMAAPIAAAVGILVINDLISHDPSAFLKNGQPNKLHVSVTLYHDLVFVLLGMAVLMLATAWFRKRLYLGMVMALYGLAIFNLRYWGFGVPFVLFGAWLLVRAYRTQRDYREATGAKPARQPARGRPGGLAGRARPEPAKRYTAPSSRPKRLSSRSRPVRENRVG